MKTASPSSIGGLASGCVARARVEILRDPADAGIVAGMVGHRGDGLGLQQEVHEFQRVLAIRRIL